MGTDGATTIDEAALGLLERVLLTTDATVVRLLEGVFGEPIGTAALAQSRGSALTRDADLEPRPGEVLLHRRALLCGARSGREYAYAETTLALERLDCRVRDALLSTADPIGRVLTVHRIETFREVLCAGRRRAGPLARRLGLGRDDDLLFRTYRIVAGGRPAMLISEYFPPLDLPGGGAWRRSPS